jgi:subtilisin family serine protease
VTYNNTTGYRLDLRANRDNPASALLASVTVSGQSGSISASPNPCSIAVGASTCATTISWQSVNAPQAGVRKRETNTLFSASAAGSVAVSDVTTTGYTLDLHVVGADAQSAVLASVAVRGTAPVQSFCPAYPDSTLPGGVKLLEFTAAWLKTCGTANVVVLDNGIYAPGGMPHPALDRVRGNFARDCVSTYPNDGCSDGLDEVDEQQFGTVPNRGRGHGTHVAGIIGATYATSDPVTGLAAVGGCRGCSLHIVRVATNETSMKAALTQAKHFGAQVANLSLGFPREKMPSNCATETCEEWTARLDELDARDVVVVAASGNTNKGSTTDIEFPALHRTVVAVGGADGSAFWFPRDVISPDVSTQPFRFGSASGPEQWLIAPATAVPSLFYYGHTWLVFSSPAEYSCRDQSTVSSLPVGFGNCTGTSMAAPHVSAIAALMKSANPLLTASQTRELLAQSGSAYPFKADDIGYGIPSAAKAVNLALGGANVTNRLTPLFSLAAVNSPSTNFNHLYTVVPQVAMSAIEGTLPPQPAGGPVSYVTYGTAVPGYASYPGCATCASQPPRAIVSVFTTHRNPSGGPELAPLYRMSWKCQTAGCVRVSHVYAVASELSTFQAAGYQVDGIDGFIYSRAQSPQPANTVKLCRKHDPARGDYILFQGTGASGGDCSGTSDGFSGSNYTEVAAGSDWLGYVHPIQPPGPAGWQ